jgi:hypothetical protein
MTGIDAQGNTPPAGKSMYNSERYWKERADQEDQLNRGAPESPYAPRYNELSRSTTRELSAAQKPLTLDEVLKDFDEKNFTFQFTQNLLKNSKLESYEGILRRDSDGRSANITIIIKLDTLEIYTFFNQIEIPTSTEKTGLKELENYLFKKILELSDPDRSK